MKNVGSCQEDACFMYFVASFSYFFGCGFNFYYLQVKLINLIFNLLFKDLKLFDVVLEPNVLYVNT